MVFEGDRDISRYVANVLFIVNFVIISSNTAKARRYTR
jgi:hypothetical protein